MRRAVDGIDEQMVEGERRNGLEAVARRRRARGDTDLGAGDKRKGKVL